jgi:hypothetical protein
MVCTSAFIILCILLSIIIHTTFLGKEGGKSSSKEGVASTYSDISDKGSNCTDSGSWTIIFEANNTLVQDTTGGNRDVHTVSVPDTQILRINISVWVESCGCGGVGEGKEMVRIQDPTGAVVYQETFDDSANVCYTEEQPTTGNWVLDLSGIAVGTEYNIGYKISVWVFNQPVIKSG